MTTETEYLQMGIDKLTADKTSIELGAKMKLAEMDNQIGGLQAKIDALANKPPILES